MPAGEQRRQRRPSARRRPAPGSPASRSTVEQPRPSTSPSSAPTSRGQPHRPGRRSPGLSGSGAATGATVKVVSASRRPSRHNGRLHEDVRAGRRRVRALQVRGRLVEHGGSAGSDAASVSAERSSGSASSALAPSPRPVVQVQQRGQAQHVGGGTGGRVPAVSAQRRTTAATGCPGPGRPARRPSPTGPSSSTGVRRAVAPRMTPATIAKSGAAQLGEHASWRCSSRSAAAVQRIAGRGAAQHPGGVVDLAVRRPPPGRAGRRSRRR